jgi:hypothetical protein
MSIVESTMDTNAFGEWIGLQTRASKQHFVDQLSEWKSNPKELISLSKRIKRLKDGFEKEDTFYDSCHTIFREIATIEEKVHPLLSKESALEKESYSELLFVRPLLQPLNFIPYFLTVWSFLRVYLLPGLSFLIPFVTLLAPYLVLKFAFQMPITLQNYMNILHSMVSGDLTQDLSSTIQPMQLLKKFGILLVTFVQGIIQPYWSYKHLQSIDQIILEHGSLLTALREKYMQLQSILEQHGFTFFTCPLPDITSERDAMARAILESSYFHLAFKYIGSLEVVLCLANQKEIHPVQWLSSSTPLFQIKNTFDFQVPEISRKAMSVSFHEKRHALLTGPNKGGKSTVLRALSVSALLAHTYGCSIGQTKMTPFHTMYVCLKPDDLPGSKSRFEREIEFTAQTLQQTKPILVFIDELYHSTNPPDALRSCRIYCEQLWKKENSISVISTHLFEWVEEASDTIQRLCCSASLDEKGDIRFDYTLTNGICKVSSVDELLKRNGLLGAPETKYQNLCLSTE